MALDRGDVAALAPLGLSAAFDTVDHCIIHAPSLCIIWHHRSGAELSWISSYLTDRQQYVWHDGVQSTHEFIKIGVPQGSVLRPLPFVLYTADLAPLIAEHRLRMIRRFTAGVNRLMSACSKITCHGVSTTCGGGCAATDCS